MYEGCKREDVNLSLVDKIDKATKKNIHSSISKLRDDAQDEQFLTNNFEYVKIINWLVHKMFMLETYRTPYIVALERRVQKKLRRFWKNNIPIIDEGISNYRYRCIEDIRSQLISDSDIVDIVYEIKNGSK